MSDFYQVAEHLSLHAKKHHGEIADSFGRSALNRYYYATYLTVRDFLSQMDKSWEGQSHSEIPTLLEGKLLKKIKDAVKNQERSGLLTTPYGKGLIASATNATSSISSILKSAYSIRVTSDYRPGEKLVFDKNGFSFGEHSDLEARNWRGRVDREKGILLKISKELGIVS